MDSIFAPDVLTDFKKRIDSLTPESQRQWGKMSVDQMLAHCALAVEATINGPQTKRSALSLIFGKIAKKSMFGDKEVKKNLPTDKNFVVADKRFFEFEKQRLKNALDTLSKGGPDKIAEKPHVFFGKMTAAEWDVLTCKHIDHHLRQFNA